jgi:tetratricopeptide (TPR) repeat protein
MRRAVPFLLFSACGLMVVSAGCRAKEPGTETASRSTSDSMAAPAERGDKIAITTASDEARTLYTRGRVLADQLRAHDARKLFEEAAAKDPNFALAHYDLAINSPTPKEFLEHVNEAVALSGKASEGERLQILALQAGVNGDSKKSLEYTEELVAKYPRDERALTLLGFAYSGQQEFGKAVGTLTKATEVNPQFAPAYNLLGYAYMPQAKYPEAERAFKKYIELVPNDPNPYDSYAEMLMRTGRFDESIAQYRKALSLEPHFSNSYIGIASNLMFQGKHDAAAAQAQKLYDGARDDGDRRTAMASRAVIFLDQGNTAKALQETEKLYALDAKLADTSAMSGDAGQMGDILLGAGRPDEAGKRYRQSLKLIEGSGLPGEFKEFAKLGDRYNLARVALAKRDLATAKSEAGAFMSGAQATGDVARIRLGHELAGMIALQEKDFDQATEHLAQADQQDPYILYTIALAYQGKGDAAKAKEFAQRAANQHTLPTIRYALVRMKASKIG